MTNPQIWNVFAGLFVLAGVLNFARATRSSGAARRVRYGLAASCIFWTAVPLLYRYEAQPYLLYGAIAGGAIVMLGSAFLGGGKTPTSRS